MGGVAEVEGEFGGPVGVDVDEADADVVLDDDDAVPGDAAVEEEGPAQAAVADAVDFGDVTDDLGEEFGVLEQADDVGPWAG